jgi:hypothetical protein
MIEYLNQNSGFFSLVFAFVVAISTLVYAILTSMLVSETRKMRKMQTEPNISIRIESNERAIKYVDIIVENIGAGPAFNIKFFLKNDLKLFANDKLSEIGFIKNGLKYLAPKQKLRYPLLDLNSVLKNDSNKLIEISVIFSDYLNEKYKSNFEINFEEFRNLLQIGSPSLLEISRSIKKISEDLSYLVSGSRRLKIDSYNSQDREKAEKEWEEEANKTKNERET